MGYIEERGEEEKEQRNWGDGKGVQRPRTLMCSACYLSLLLQCGLAHGSMEPAHDELAERLGSGQSAGASGGAASAAGVPAGGRQQQGGQVAAAAAAAAAAGEGAVTPWAPRWRMRWRAQQRGVVRFNCADSLDRTNAATCFAMLPVGQGRGLLLPRCVSEICAGEELCVSWLGPRCMPGAALPTCTECRPTCKLGRSWLALAWKQSFNGPLFTPMCRSPALPCFSQALQEGLRLLGISLDCGGPGLQSPGAAALQKGSRLPSRGTTASSSAQDLQVEAA